MSPDWAANAIPVPYADFGDPQTLNLYGYTNNKPLRSVDRDGHCPWCIVIGVGVVVYIGYELHEFAEKGDQRQREADARMSEFFNNPSTAPMKDLTDASRDTKVELEKDAAALALKNINPSHGSDSVGEALVDLAVDQAKGAVIDNATQNARGTQAEQQPGAGTNSHNSSNNGQNKPQQQKPNSSPPHQLPPQPPPSPEPKPCISKSVC